MKNIFKIFGFLLIFLVAACDLDGDLENPNQVSVAGADVDLLMNTVQAEFAMVYNDRDANGNSSGASNILTQLVRISAMIGGDRYQTAIRSTATDDLWTEAYQGVLINAETLIPLAEEKGFTTHVAVAKILEAYTYFILVDAFGDVPQSEALHGLEGNYNPVADGGKAVYDKALTLLDEARVELAKTDLAVGGPLKRDVYYGGNRAKWNALANTLELRAMMNIAMIPSETAAADARIDALLGMDLIDEESENFTYKYAAVTVPSSRHPQYDQYYSPTIASAGGYVGNNFMWELYQGMGVQDPRWRYYLYRQVGSNQRAFEIDPKNVGCGAKPAHYAAGNYVFCQFEPGFYGRDHGDDSGTNPDSPFITCFGAYPAGGKIDAKPTTDRTFHAPTIRGDGGNGAGIDPIWMSFFTDFLKAEYKARKGQDAKAELLAGISNSITQVRAFSNKIGQVLPAGLEPSTSAYTSAVATLYDNKGDAKTDLEVIGREFHMACFGNGVEAYNLYRRTGAPVNMQPTRVPNPGVYYHSLIYPAVYANLNSNAKQKESQVLNPVFWDPKLDLK